MKLAYIVHLVTVAMAAPKASEGVTLANFDSVVDTSDPFIKQVWENAVSFKEGGTVKPRSVETSSGSGLERRCDRKGYQLCIAVCNTGCATGCRCGSCFSICPKQCKGWSQYKDC